jgi:polyisoprenoid-binding protein YceI
MRRWGKVVRPLLHLASAGIVAGVLVPLALAQTPASEARTLTLDPAATKITFTLGATLHTVEGSVELSHGEVRFDPAGGAASGEVVMEARTAQTGNSSRDARMQREVLESARFPTIVFRAESLELLSRSEAGAQVRLRGSLDLHGRSLPFELPAALTARGDRVSIAATFRVPYVDWGIEDPSNFLLRVDRFVDVAVKAEGTLESP